MITNIQTAIQQASKYAKIKTTILVVDSNEDILILQRSASDKNGGTWELPGGRIEFSTRFDETYLNTEVKQEVLEEAGLVINTIDFAYMLPRGLLQGNYMFVGTLNQPVKPSISHEHDSYKLIRAKQAIELLSFENHRNLVKKYMKQI
jgi:8-oxo-dGTP pyrophosphatase MutT (NUDIX family)